MNSIFIGGFIVGALTVTSGRYCLDGFLNHRRKSVDELEQKKLGMEMLFTDHPEFMTLFRNTINAPGCTDVREFFVVEKNAILNTSIPRFRFELSAETLPVLNKLEQMGYIQRLENNCLHYKISDECIVQMNSVV